MHFYIAGVQKLSLLRMFNGISLLTFVGVNSMWHIHTVLLYNESAQALIVTVLKDGPLPIRQIKGIVSQCKHPSVHQGQAFWDKLCHVTDRIKISI